jgi:hypothetical protein
MSRLGVAIPLLKSAMSLSEVTAVLLVPSVNWASLTDVLSQKGPSGGGIVTFT